MKKVMPIFAILFVSMCIVSCKSDKEELSLFIYSPIGTVTIISDGTQKTPQDGDFISIGDSVRTGPLSSADIMLGNIGIVRVYENSLVHIKSLIDPDTGDTKIEMDQGKLYSTLEKLKRGSFQVKTPTSVASIRGTSFRMSAARNESRLDVIDGKVQINPVENNTVIEDVKNLVEANQTVSIDKATLIDVIKKKRGLKVKSLDRDEIKKIREEIKTLKPGLMKKKRAESRKKLEKKILDAREKIKAAKEKYKLKMERFKERKNKFAEKLKEKKQAFKEKQQSLREARLAKKNEKLNQSKADGKMSFKEKLEKLGRKKPLLLPRKRQHGRKIPRGICRSSTWYNGDSNTRIPARDAGFHFHRRLLMGPGRSYKRSTACKKPYLPTCTCLRYRQMINRNGNAE